MNKTSLLNAALTPVVTIFFGVLALVLATKLIGPLPLSVSQTTTTKNDTFNVSGMSEITTQPDEASVSVGITTQAPTVAQAQDEANRIINNISSEVKSLGVTDDNIQTTSYNINPNYDWESPTRRITGYGVDVSLRIKVEQLDRINQVIDTATRNGANNVNGISFGLSDDKQEQLTKQAREEAIEDAKSNAEELSRLAGMRLGKIVNVSENAGGGYQPPMMRTFSATADVAEAAAPTNVEAGSTTFSYNVTLSYETL